MKRVTLPILGGLALLLSAAPPVDGRVMFMDIAEPEPQQGLPLPGGTVPPDVGWSRNGRRGASTALEPDGARMWVADTDGDSLVVMDTSRNAVVGRVNVGDGPEQVAVAPGGRVFATLRWDGAVVAVDPRSRAVVARARVGVEPYGLAVSPGGDRVYVTSAQDSTLTALDARTLQPIWTGGLGDPDPRGISLAPDGRRGYVVHLRTPRVSVVDMSNGRVVERLSIPSQRAITRGQSASRGPFGPASAMPNRMLASVVSPNGQRLYVGFDIKDTGANIAEGQRTGGYGAGAPAPIVASVASIALDGSGVTQVAAIADTLDPSDLRIDDEGKYLFVAGAGPGVGVFAIETGMMSQRASIPGEYAESVQLVGGRILAHDPVSFAVRSIGPMPGAPPSPAVPPSVVSIGRDPLPASVAGGRALFFQRHREISANAFACQSCHPDGRTDGLTWNIDLGPRQTPILAGHVAETAPYHWLGSAPTLQAAIRETVARLGGSGLDSTRIDGLAAFVTDGLHAIPNAPARATDAGDVRRGRELFQSADLGCASCHMPERAFQSGGQELLGVVSRSSSSRAMRRFDVPSLRNLGASAPYLHDGSAPDLRSVLLGFNHDDRMGATAALSPADLDALVTYLRTL